MQNLVLVEQLSMKTILINYLFNINCYLLQDAIDAICDDDEVKAVSYVGSDAVSFLLPQYCVNLYDNFLVLENDNSILVGNMLDQLILQFKTSQMYCRLIVYSKWVSLIFLIEDYVCHLICFYLFSLVIGDFLSVGTSFKIVSCG